MQKDTRQRRKKIKHCFFIIILIICIVGLIIFFSAKINNVNVVGNNQIAKEEIEQNVLQGRFGHNSVVVYLKNLFGKQYTMPFLEKYEITFKSFTSIEVRVYEKKIIAYFDYMDSYMFINKDGVVEGNSKNKIHDVPKVTGLNFEYIILHEKLPVKNEKIFKRLLDIFLLVNKYKLDVLEINIDDEENLKLYIKNVVVELGNDNYLNEKISDLSGMNDKLIKYKGVLDMKKYNSKGNYTLKK